MIKIESCPVCEQASFSKVFKAQYFRGKAEEFQIQECNNCKLWFTSPRPSNDELGAYYESEDYVSHTDKKESIIDKVYHVVRNYAVRSKVGLVNKYASRGRLLDYGAGTGFFLGAAKKSGWQVNGVEPSEVARQNAKAVNGVELHSPETFDWTAAQNQYDCITLWHVMEHLPNLKQDLANFAGALKTDGVMFIAVPNHESYDAQVYGKDWAALDVPLHLYHFKKRNVKLLAEEFGFDMEDIINMPFDSFYVSMLSEKNKNGKNNYFRAISNGIRSNLKGRNNQNASSLIYVLRKRK